MQKLDAEGITYDRDQAIVDGRYRRPVIYRPIESHKAALNESAQVNSAADASAKELLDVAEAGERRQPPKSKPKQ